MTLCVECEQHLLLKLKTCHSVHQRWMYFNFFFLIFLSYNLIILMRQLVFIWFQVFGESIIMHAFCDNKQKLGANTQINCMVINASCKTNRSHIWHTTTKLWEEVIILRGSGGYINHRFCPQLAKMSKIT